MISPDKIRGQHINFCSQVIPTPFFEVFLTRFGMAIKPNDNREKGEGTSFFSNKNGEI
jgi:hypothetical protein